MWKLYTFIYSTLEVAGINLNQGSAKSQFAQMYSP